MGHGGGMERLSVGLLGSPSIEPASEKPKGKKLWALLTYLTLSDGPHSRNHLAELLFANAEDPLGALRWNLAQLRRLLSLPDSLRGSQITLSLGPHAVIDVRVLTSGTWMEAARLRGLGADLLEGMTFPSEPEFETWLMLEREHIRSVAQSVLREAASASLGMGRPQVGADFAARAIALDPFDESSHELLIRGLVAAGSPDKANEALQRCRRTFLEQLGVEPGDAIKNALSIELPRTAQASGSAAARAQLDLGRSAIRAGAIDTGLESLRAAVGAAEGADDGPLLSESLLALAYALIHSVRGRDGEATTLLHRARDLASRHDLPAIAAECLRELGYVEMLVGSYDRALASLEQALTIAELDEAGRAWALAYQAICYSDTGRYASAVECLAKCLSMPDSPEVAQPRAYALCLLGRIQMLRGELTAARATLERCISVATGCGWTVLLPWPQALLAEAELLDGGEPDEVRARLEHTLSLAQQIGDPCWEGAALHGLGLVAATSGAVDEAAQRLEQASTVCTRFPDTYIWMKAYVLDAMCDVATREGLSSDKWIDDLQNLAARTGMNELLARAYLYRGRAGDEAAIPTARLIAREVDNPALSRLF
jgi:DNA-binding SARP family transcriptional activator